MRNEEADCAVLPVENSIYGRVADIHRLLPDSGLHIIDEAFVPIHINLLAIPGTPLERIRTALSHLVLLGQCFEFLRGAEIDPLPWVDTAGAAKHVAECGIRSQAALASELAGEIYGLETVVRHIEDQEDNRTRFFVMARETGWRERQDGLITSLLFRVRNIPAALYKALGGFATNKVNMTKLESYMIGGSFAATEFFAEVEGHPDDENLGLALEELRFFTDYVNIIGVYPASPARNA